MFNKDSPRIWFEGGNKGDILTKGERGKTRPMEWVSPGEIGGTVTIVSVQFDKSDDELEGISGLSASLETGKTYEFKVVLFYDADVVGGQKYGLGGSCVADMVLAQVNAVCNATKSFVITERLTSLGGGGAGEAGSVAGMVEISGVLTVSEGGIFMPQFGQEVPSGLSSILVGSHMIMRVVSVDTYFEAGYFEEGYFE